MARKAAKVGKTLNASNLAALGADQLAGLLVEVAARDANWKRRLKLRLAGRVGAADLALEIDKRLSALAESRVRVSWRKRAGLIEDLSIHRRAIVDDLAPADGRLAFDRLVAWFDLFPGLSVRVKDPKGEMSALFFDAVPDLAAVASRVETGYAAETLSDALRTRSSEWAVWMGRAAPDLPRPLAQALINGLTKDRSTFTARSAVLVRKLADRAGDVRAWIETVPEADRCKPEVGAQIARRLVGAGNIVDARDALETARPQPPPRSRWSRDTAERPAEPCDAWDEAEIEVLAAENRSDEAQAARWRLFERTLSERPLKDHLARLPDFEDVEALDRAYAVAAGWHDPTRGLAFLMNWPALREAAETAVNRAGDINGLVEELPLWVSRLSERHPAAALALVRAQARAFARQGSSHADAVRGLAMEAAALAETVSDPRLPSHAAFIDELDTLSKPVRRAGWR